jgi:hypothetical protein
MSSNFHYKSIPLNRIILDSLKYNTNDGGIALGALGFCNDVKQTQYRDSTINNYSFLTINAYNVWQNFTNLNPSYSDYFTLFFPGTKTRDYSAYYDEYTAVQTHTITLSTQQKQLFTSIVVLLIGAGGSGGAGGGDTGGRSGTNGAAGGGGGFIIYNLTNVSNINFFNITIGQGGASVSGGSNNNGNNGLPGTSTILNVNNSIECANAGGGGGGGGGRPTSSASPGIGGTTTIDNTNTFGTPQTAGFSPDTIYPGFSPGYNSNDSNSSLRSLNGYYAAMPLTYSTTPLIYWYAQLQNVMTSQTRPYGRGGAGTSGGTSVNNTPTTPGGNGYARVYYII